MRAILSFIVVSLLFTGCATTQPYTVDDGRQVNETLLADIRSYGAGERVLRPAIARSSALKDRHCDMQWELPFSVASSYDASTDDRVAWVRALGVDERVTVVGTAPGSPVQLRDRIRTVAGNSSENPEKILLDLATRRDLGQPFDITLYSGKTATVKPFQVCRGYTRLAPPASPTTQDYHWLLSVHPLQVAEVSMSDDEALWMVLWTQGLSEEGGARMKTYDFGSKIAGTLYNLFTIASGIKGATVAASTAIRAAQTAAATATSNLVKQQLIEQATAMAAARARGEINNTLQKLRQQNMMNIMQMASGNRSSLSGIAWVAASSFEKADAWAYAGLEKLRAHPLAGFSLHQKLTEQGLAANSMVLDAERMKALNQIAEARGRGDEVIAVLRGLAPDELQAGLADMPFASAPTAFSYESPADPGPGPGATPFSRGLIDGMLSMPLASTLSN
jgi:hypothetical protein